MIPFVELQSVNDVLLGAGACNFTKGGYLGEFSANCIGALVDSAHRMLAGISGMEIGYQHGAQDRLAEDYTAFPDCHADHFLNVITRWSPGDGANPTSIGYEKLSRPRLAWQSDGTYTISSPTTTPPGCETPTVTASTNG